MNTRIIPFIMVALVAAMLPLQTPAQEEKDPRVIKKEMEAKGREFRREFNKAKTEGEKVNLVKKLAENKHEVIASELVNLLRLDLNKVRLAACDALSAYSNEPEIADGMLKYAAAIDSDQVVMAILDAVEKIAACRGMARLGGLFSKSDNVATKAIEVAGKVRSRLTVMPLIAFMAELEKIKPIYDFPDSIPGVGGRGRNRNNDNQRRITNQAELNRKNRLIPKIKDALNRIIRQKFPSAGHYRGWWKANASKFADPEDERLMEEKKKK